MTSQRIILPASTTAESFRHAENVIKEACRNPGASLRFACATPEQAGALVRLVRLAHSLGAASIEVERSDWLENTAKVTRALELAGLTDWLPSDTPNTTAADLEAERAAWFRRHPELLPQDFVQTASRLSKNEQVREAIIRPVYRCNEKCHFCWIYQEQDDPPAATSAEAVARLARQGFDLLTISGGEPTLFHGLPELIRQAKTEGFRWVTLQTNGLLLAQATRVKALVEAGLDEVFLALHAADPAIHDTITQHPGAHAKTLQAFDHLLDAPLKVCINVVLCRPNLADLPALAQLLAERAERIGRDLTLNLAVAAPMGRYAEHYAAYTPRLTELQVPLTEALDILRKSRVRYDGFSSACGAPLCAVGNRPDLLAGIAPLPDSERGAEFVQPAACESCRLRAACHGVRRVYIEVFGPDDLQPFRES